MLKKLVLTLFIFLLPSRCSCVKQKLAEGVYYEQKLFVVPDRLSMHLLEVDPSLAKIELVAANDQCVGAEKVSDIARRKNAIAAVNGSFYSYGNVERTKELLHKALACFGFHFYNAFPCWMLKIKDTWFSDSKRCLGAIGWTEDCQNVLIGRLGVDWDCKIGDTQYPISSINKERDSSSAILYTTAFGKTTHTNREGVEIVIDNGKVQNIIHGVGNAAIPKNGFVYSVGWKSKVRVSSIRREMPIELFPLFNTSVIDGRENSSIEEWEGMDFILGSYPVLISHGNTVSNFWQEVGGNSFYDLRHPRTSVGILPDGHWIFLVVDGYQAYHSVGMTMKELAGFMKEQGCVAALNLDGGGSSVFVLNGEVVNSPAGFYQGFYAPKPEKAISDAIVILKR